MDDPDPKAFRLAPRQTPHLQSAASVRYKTTGQLNHFGEMLENIFSPIFEATLFPEQYPDVAEFLEHISGFDTVDDESRSEKPVDRTFSSKTLAPQQWDIADNPSYKYYSYFIQSNLRLLNLLRVQLGMNTFAYRPHAGEAGEVHHLDTAFLLADGINHGLNLRKSMGLRLGLDSRPFDSYNMDNIM